MQPYIDQANQKKAAYTQQQQADQSHGEMLHELQKMQMAALMGQPKPSVVLTDQTDLGDAMRQHTEHVVGAISGLNRDEAVQEELMALKSIEIAVETLERSTKTDFSDLITAIRAIDVKPTIQVAAPKVTVQERPVDFTPLQDTLESLLGKDEGKTDLDDYRAQDLKEDGDIQYVGFVNPAGNWYIIENNVKENTMRYLFGTDKYQQHFKNAATYVYKLMNEAINATA